MTHNSFNGIPKATHMNCYRLLLTLCFIGLATHLLADERPNIVFIVADDKIMARPRPPWQRDRANAIRRRFFEVCLHEFAHAIDMLPVDRSFRFSKEAAKGVAAARRDIIEDTVEPDIDDAPMPPWE